MSKEITETQNSKKVSEYLIKRIRKELKPKYIRLHIPKGYR